MKQDLTVNKETHFGIARKIVSNMTTESWEAIPHGIITYETECSEFMRVVKEINKDATKDTKLTINTIMLRVMVEAIKAAPCLNSHIDFNKKLVRGCVKQFDEINISMPIILNSGEMMTLNMKNMHNKNIREMSEAIKEKAARANKSDMNEVMYQVSLEYTLAALAKGRVKQTLLRLIGSKTGKHKVHNLHGKAKKEYYSIPETERITHHDIEQGTITVTNLGSIYREWNGICTVLEIVPPQTSAIAIGSIQKRPIVAEDGSIKAGNIMPITLAFDHRAFDMGDVVPFMKKLDEIFANPDIIKEWV